MKSQATIFPSLPGRGIRAIKEMVRLLILLLFFSPALFAQTAVLRGLITDASGAVVPGATVTLTRTAGTPQAATAGNNGSYSFPGIAPGSYTVQASAPDLTSGALKLELKPGLQTLDIQLKVLSV